MIVSAVAGARADPRRAHRAGCAAGHRGPAGPLAGRGRPAWPGLARDGVGIPGPVWRAAPALGPGAAALRDSG